MFDADRSWHFLRMARDSLQKPAGEIPIHWTTISSVGAVEKLAPMIAGRTMSVLALATELLNFFALSLDFSLVGVRLSLLIGLPVLLSLELIAN